MIPAPQQYTLPVSLLLTVGDARNLSQWPDYPAAYGLTRAHIPDLIRMMQDEGLNWADSDSDEVWAPIHAWRALGQLRAESAIDAIIDTFYTIDEGELTWQQEEYPTVMAMIGPAAIPALTTYLADENNGVWSLIVAGESLVKIGQQYPEFREECAAILAHQLRHYQGQDSSQNAFLVSGLIDLHAVAAADVMEAAFKAGAVDLSVSGDWEEVQIALGLLARRQTPRPKYGWIREEMIPMVETTRRLLDDFRLAGPANTPDSWGKVGRNDPCPCGSGKKYKKCHGQVPGMGQTMLK